MLRTLNPFSKKTNLNKYEEPRKPKAVQPTYVYRDELNATKKPPSQNKIKKKVRFNLDGEQRGESEEAECGVKNNSSGGGCQPEVINGGGGGGVKVKILMTKEEAARLLSRCKDGGVLDFKDVANQLVDIPLSRVAVVSCGGAVEDAKLSSEICV